MSFHNDHDIDFVLKELVGQPGFSTWIGLETNRAGGWKWSDSTSVQYTHWKKGEPSSDAENCVEMMADGFWNDAYCNGYKSMTHTI